MVGEGVVAALRPSARARTVRPGYQQSSARRHRGILLCRGLQNPDCPTVPIRQGIQSVEMEPAVLAVARDNLRRFVRRAIPPDQPDKRVYSRGTECIDMALHPFKECSADLVTWYAGLFEQRRQGRLPIDKPTAKTGQQIDHNLHETLATPVIDGWRPMPLVDAPGDCLGQFVVRHFRRLATAQCFEMCNPVTKRNVTPDSIQDR